MRNAAARGFETKAPFKNNLPPQIGDVIVNPINPVNPDSKPMAAAHIISN
jgi:hypothetical protein